MLSSAFVFQLISIHILGEMKGLPLKFKVARLETHIKTNGKWQMASGSGTFTDPLTSIEKEVILYGLVKKMPVVFHKFLPGTFLK